MALVESLLSAIVRADGDALVLHVGERPSVVAASGQVELSSRALTLEAMAGLLGQLLSPDAAKSLEDLGAVEHDLPALSSVPDERFTVVAARGGNDIWIEIRRQRRVTPPVEESPAEAGSDQPEPVRVQPEAVVAKPEPPVTPLAVVEPGRSPVLTPVPAGASDYREEEPVEPRQTPRRRKTDRVVPPEPDIPAVTMVPVPPSRTQTPRMPHYESQSAVVLSLSRSPVRGNQTPRVVTSPKLSGLDRLLLVAAARGASTLYLVSGSRPSIRVDGEISTLEAESPLDAPEVESLILDLMPERNREALRSDVGTEWICDVPDVGRVRCMSFRDHRGAGGIFRMIPARAISAEQLGLSREVQGLCAEPEGLVLVTGPRSSGKSTLIAAFVDLINRTRSDHVITLESQIKFVHESRSSLVSQREVRGDNEELVAVTRAALRENPDVLVIEDLRTPQLVNVALDAAESGHLVIGSLSAHTTTAAIDRLIDQTAPERRPKIQLALAEALRGIVAQVLVRKTGGGRLAARELLLNTSSVANLIAEGKTSQLPLVLDGGRKYGMVPLNDALVAFVQSGVIDPREAYRNASDHQGFLNQLKREGVDTSFVERLA